MYDPVSKSVSVMFRINRGIVVDTFAKGGKLLTDTSRPENTVSSTTELPLSTSLENLKEEFFDLIRKTWNIDPKSSKIENGGKGFGAQLTCTITVPAEPAHAGQITQMTLPNEDSWEAAKFLMQRAQGGIVVFMVFADKKLSKLDRWALKFLQVPV